MQALLLFALVQLASRGLPPARACPPSTAPLRVPAPRTDLPAAALGDLVLRGIVVTARGAVALFEHRRTGRSHFLKVGDALGEGRITAIDGEGVDVRVELPGPSGPRIQELRLTPEPRPPPPAPSPRAP